MPIPPAALATRIDGLLAFSTTPFGQDGELAPAVLRSQLRRLLESYPCRPSAFFVCCGAGELWALDLPEYWQLVRAAVEETAGAIPVFAGIGGGVRLALEFVRAATDAGADGMLAFPPYLADGPQDGLRAHYGAVAAATDRAVILYNRAHAVFEPDTVRRLVADHPNIIGLKDGLGDMDRLAAIRERLGPAFLLLNGMPCAELHAPTFRQARIPAYSPSAIDFWPELAWAYHAALQRGEPAQVEHFLDGFYRPYAAMRTLVPGYGVSLSKAARALRGDPAGGVRPPLVDPAPEHLAMLASLLERGRVLIQASPDAAIA